MQQAITTRPCTQHARSMPAAAPPLTADPGRHLPPALRRFLITEKLLLRRTLPLPQLALLTQHLLPAAYPDALLPSTASLARAWSDVSGIQSLPLPQQGYLTTGLQLCLGQLPAACMQSAAGAELLGLLMTGVSSRLSSPMPAVRLQVGVAMLLLVWCCSLVLLLCCCWYEAHLYMCTARANMPLPCWHPRTHSGWNGRILDGRRLLRSPYACAVPPADWLWHLDEDTHAAGGTPQRA
jgi:hypothetical protein